MDLLASRPLVRDLDLYAAAENLLDAQCDIGRTPLRTLAPPRSFRVGVRLSLAATP